MIRTRFLLGNVVRSEKIRNSFVNFAILQTYFNIRGHLKIQPNFVVGDSLEDAKLWPIHYLGFKLGSYAQYLLSGLKRGQYSPEITEKLESLGLGCVSTNNDDTLLLAASTYIRLYGSTEVPKGFKVPENSPEWPPETWGMYLGGQIVTMKYAKKDSIVRKQLMELGICFDVKRHKEYDVYLNAMKVFKTINGEEKMDRSFVVPLEGDDRYDPEARGLRLGLWVETIRHNQEKWPMYKEELEQMGVNFNIKNIKRAKIDDIFVALTNYYLIHGHLKIPASYSVPFQDPLYPEEAWGLKIGRSLALYRQGGYAKHRHRLFDLIGEPLEAGKKTDLSFQQLYDALVVYRMIHGHLNVVNTYVIPSDDQRYPEGVRGASLGVVVRNVRLANTRSQHRDALVALGLDLGKRQNKRNGFDKAFACLEAYKRANGHLDVPHEYKVPANDPHYPEGAEGFNLGRLVANIRYKDNHKEHREKLEALGFSYKVDRHLQYMNKVVAALTTYQRLHGSLDVRPKFIVAADDEEYPEETRGLRLGDVVYYFKKGKLNNKYSDRLQQMGLMQH